MLPVRASVQKRSLDAGAGVRIVAVVLQRHSDVQVAHHQHRTPLGQDSRNPPLQDLHHPYCGVTVRFQTQLQRYISVKDHREPAKNDSNLNEGSFEMDEMREEALSHLKGDRKKDRLLRGWMS
jgi:hypothetical protein